MSLYRTQIILFYEWLIVVNGICFVNEGSKKKKKKKLNENNLLKTIEKQINHHARVLPQMKPDLLEYLMSNFSSHIKHVIALSKMRMN